MLNSEDPEIRRFAVAELEVQAELMDGMGLGEEAVIVLHVGGAVGGVDAGLDASSRASGCSRRRPRTPAVENDDRWFGLGDVLRFADAIGRRSSGTRCTTTATTRTGSGPRGARARVATWPDGVTPKIHYSTPKTALEERTRRVGRRVERTIVLPQLRAHADLIDPIGFEWFLEEVAGGHDFDVMLEAKAKDLALLRLREQLRASGARA